MRPNGVQPLSFQALTPLYTGSGSAFMTLSSITFGLTAFTVIPFFASATAK
jgi:hypothetical protein